MKAISAAPEETRRLGIKLGRRLKPGDIIALTGGLGAGKTVLVQGIAAGMGIEGNVTSPTYLIIQEHPGPVPLYHIDAYRLEDSGEMEELGYEEYFFGTGVTVIEWADRIRGLLPPEYLRIDLGPGKEGGEQDRCLVFTAHGRRYVTLLEELKKDADLGC